MSKTFATGHDHKTNKGSRPVSISGFPGLLVALSCVSLVSSRTADVIVFVLCTTKKGLKVTTKPKANLLKSLVNRLGVTVPARSGGRDGSGGRSRARRLILPIFGAFTTAFCLLSFAVPAFAGRARIFTGSFGAASSTTIDPYPLAIPARGVLGNTGFIQGDAIDQSTGDIYVADPLNHRIEKFGPQGEFILMFGSEVNANPMAADRSLCTILETCQTGTAGTTPGAFASGAALHVAVDNSTGPSQGDVYVADSSVFTGGDDKVSKFDSSGHLITGWSSGGQLDGSTSSDGPFKSLRGIAVDPSGDLWVYSTGEGQRIARIFEFDQSAGFITDWSTHAGENPQGVNEGIAVDSEDNVYLAISGALVLKYTSGGALLSTIAGPFTDEVSEYVRPTALTIDSSSNSLYVFNSVNIFQKNENFSILRYEPSCQALSFGSCTAAESITSGHLQSDSAQATALAVNPSSPGDTIYASEPEEGLVAGFSVVTVPDVSTARASSVTSDAGILNGTINPANELVTECFFEWGETASYGRRASCENSPGSGTSPVEVHANVTGLQAGKVYHFRLIAGNANDVNSVTDEPSTGQDSSFGSPLIDSVSSSSVASTSATLNAEVNPEGADTHVQIEYGTDTGYGQSTAEVDIGSGEVIQHVSYHIQDLTPDKVYHYRVIATNVLSLAGGATSADQTFTTQPVGGGLVLPDGRRWELVTPPDKHGAQIVPLSGGSLGTPGPRQAAEDGSGIAYLTNTPTEAEPPGYGQFQGADEVLSTRGARGWSTRDIATPHDSATFLFTLPEYDMFSANLSSGLATSEGQDNTLLSPNATEQTPYIREEDLCDASATAAECYSPILTGKEGLADVAPGTQFGPFEARSRRVFFEGASPDLRHVVLASKVPLTDTAPAASEGGVYEWSAGSPPREALQLVSLLPPDEGGGPVPVQGISVGPTHFPTSISASRHAISDDGSRIFWESNHGSGGALYLRDTLRPETVRLDVKQPGAPAGGEPDALFQIASADGSTVYFTDGQKLTGNSGAAGPTYPDLYECEIVEEAGKLACSLTDLTSMHSEQPAAIRNLVVGAAEDGAYVYFVANGVLSDNANSHGDKASPGSCAEGQSSELASATCNLYEIHAGVTTFVATLSRDDQTDWGVGTNDFHTLSNLTAHTSPDGRFMTFMSQRSLTGYDNRDAVSGNPDAEVYVFDAVSGRLSCVSCDPFGARPHGIEGREFTQFGKGPHVEDVADVPVHTAFAANADWFAASLPPGVYLNSEEIGGGSLYQSRVVSNEGRVFFDSSDALVPQDVNGNEDVYEFEPVGVGSCSEAASTFSVVSGGCTSLVSSGTSPEESGFLDASQSGGDVFFMTASRLTSQDLDRSFDIYDAHECSATVPCLSATGPVPACDAGDSCKAAPSPQPAIFGAPASATFSGPGNLTPPMAVKAKPKPRTRAQQLASALNACRKQHGKKRTVCERKARKRFGALRTKKATIKRRGKR
jgi:hypothetical protein